MLSELHCDKFKEKKITFHEGLNVVLGDNKATNSIGKSTLLMVLDFVFGGDSLLDHNSDIVTELGDHDYTSVFKFGSKKLVFKRNTATPDLVHCCDHNLQELDPISIDDYRAMLKSLYQLDDIELTFRSTVSLYSRVWGKENLDVNQPLHAFKKQRAADCINNLIKLYEKYGTIALLSKLVSDLSSQKKTISSAYRQNLIPKINKTKYKDNLKTVSNISTEISDIKENLAIYAVSINEIIDREVSELKADRDNLLLEKTKVSSRLQRVRNDLSKNKHIKSKAFKNLVKFFPDADVERFTKVEEFHSSITRILKSELKESESELSEQLQDINAAIASIDEKIDHAFSNIDNPSAIVDRVHVLANQHSAAQREIQFFEQEEQVATNLKSETNNLKQEKSRITKLISDIINNKIRKLVNSIYNEHRKSPKLTISDNNYTYVAIEDTGTGKAYSNLILMDLAVLKTTILPFLIHDSVLFKNIENEAVANLINLYASEEKQTFIAIDEIQKYGTKAENVLLQNKVIQLDDQNQLYIKDWRD